jgi:Mrp family chromosome partitioning ATPase
VADLQTAGSFSCPENEYRIVRSDRPLKTILVTSADVGDGKTYVAANLAMFMAQRRKKVVLVDADMRRPTIHEYYNLDNDKGLPDFSPITHQSART